MSYNVTTIIFTLNEYIHLRSCFESLKWCDDVIVVDSYSTDRTALICSEAGVRFYQHAFQGFGVQRNWALEHVQPKYNWILILDADERVTLELAEELREIAKINPQEIGAYCIKRRFYMWGRWLKHSSLYPTWVVRFIHKDRVRYKNRGHAETQNVVGRVSELKNDLIDENLKGIDEWFERQNRYSSKDAEYELQIKSEPFKVFDLVSSDPLKRRAVLKKIAIRLPGRPILYFIYVYIFRLGFLDGKDGFVFCIMKALYQRMIVIKKYNMRKMGQIN